MAYDEVVDAIYSAAQLSHRPGGRGSTATPSDKHVRDFRQQLVQFLKEVAEADGEMKAGELLARVKEARP